MRKLIRKVMDVNERERLQFDTSKATMLLNGRYLVEFYCSRNRKNTYLTIEYSR